MTYYIEIGYAKDYFASRKELVSWARKVTKAYHTATPVKVIRYAEQDGLQEISQVWLGAWSGRAFQGDIKNILF